MRALVTLLESWYLVDYWKCMRWYLLECLCYILIHMSYLVESKRKYLHYVMEYIEKVMWLLIIVYFLQHECRLEFYFVACGQTTILNWRCLYTMIWCILLGFCVNIGIFVIRFDSVWSCLYTIFLESIERKTDWYGCSSNGQSRPHTVCLVMGRRRCKIVVSSTKSNKVWNHRGKWFTVKWMTNCAAQPSFW